MNRKKIIKTEKPRLFTEVDIDADCNSLDIILIDARERGQNPDDYADYLWGSSDPLLAGVYQGDNGSEVYSIEISGFRKSLVGFDLLDYIRNKKIIPAEIIMSDDENSPEQHTLNGDENAFILRFSNHKNYNTLYQTNENVFFGFDEKGILSEFIYLGKELAEKLSGKAIVAALEKYPNRKIKERMEAALRDESMIDL